MNKYSTLRALADVSKKVRYQSPGQPEVPYDCNDPAEKKNIIKFLLQEYGNPTFIIEITDSIINLAKRFKRNNRAYQNSLSFLQNAIPAGVFTSELFSKIQKFREGLQDTKSIYDMKTMRIVEILGIKKEDFFDVSKNYSVYIAKFDLGKEVSEWAMKGPKTELFKIMGIYQSSDLKKIDEFYSVNKGEVFTLIEYRKELYVWEISFYRSEIDDSLHIVGSQVYLVNKKVDQEASFKLAECLKNDIYKEFLKSLDISYHVVELDGNGLKTRKRIQKEEPINQFDMNSLEKEIEKVLARGKKRGYAFVGIPGTGKTSIIRSLEARLLNMLIIHISPSAFSSTSSIKETFDTVRHIQPCFVIIEDIDSFDFEQKNSRLASFLEEIDDVHNRLNLVLVCTVNDTNLVHYSLINRPGRIDQVCLLSPPKTVKEAYEVMKIKAEKENYAFPSLNKLSKEHMNRIINSSFTQADICEIINKSILLSNKFSNKIFLESIQSLESTKIAIKSCKFNKMDPNSDIEDCVPECEPGSLGGILSPSDIKSNSKREKRTFFDLGKI